MVWALWGLDKFFAPTSSLVATLTVSWLPRSTVLSRVSYYTSSVNSTRLNIVLGFFFFLIFIFYFLLWCLVEVGCSTDMSEILAVSILKRSECLVACAYI